MKKHIESIITFQKELIYKLKELYPDVKDYSFLFDFPRNGSLNLNKSVWCFYKHGVGMKFTRKHPKPSIVIDMHVNLDNPYIIDDWRVIQYLESINVLYTKEQVDNELLILSLQGYLSKMAEIPTRFLYNDKKI